MKSAPYLDIPMNKPSRQSIRKDAKLGDQKNINRMGTYKILEFVYKRHETEILYVTLGIVLTLMVLNWIGVI